MLKKKNKTRKILVYIVQIFLDMIDEKRRKMTVFIINIFPNNSPEIPVFWSRTDFCQVHQLTLTLLIALQIGDLWNDLLTIDKEPEVISLYSNIPAQCIGQCAQCELAGMEDEKFIYINGDFHIAGK